jgi:hypothetical protein
VARVIKAYGTTEDIWMAGWILPDGSMIDLNRRAQLVEHNAAAGYAFGIAWSVEGTWSERPSATAEQAGWVRVLKGADRGVSFEYMRPLTAAQRRRVLEATRHARVMCLDVSADPRYFTDYGSLYYSGDQPASPTRMARYLQEADEAARSQLGHAMQEAPVTPPDTWGYHATTIQSLPAILRDGLQPRRQPRRHAGEARSTRDAVIYFSPTADLAQHWGEVVLRFPFPDNAEPDPYSDTLLLEDGSITESGWVSRDPISPDRLQVRDGNSVTSEMTGGHGDPGDRWGILDRATVAAVRSRVVTGAQLA